jgi:uncharacterized protein (DUF2141 family)
VEIMSKVRSGAWLLSTAFAAASLACPAQAAIEGPHAARCTSGAGPAMLVRVSGFKARTGTVRVQSYGGDPKHYFDKGTYLERVDVRVPSAGALEVCMPVSAPGRYAVSVRHDLNGSGKSDRSDGGGMSGNPDVSLMDLLFKRKPDPDRVAVEVAHGVRTVPVTLNYVSGTSFRPVEAAN